MATGFASDFSIKNEEFYAGMNETATQIIELFNEASLGTIRLVTKPMKGDYDKERVFEEVDDLITRRDTTTVSAVTALKLEDHEVVGVKCNRKVGPVAQSVDSFIKLGMDESTLSFVLGGQVAKARQVNMINTAIAALIGACKTNSTMSHQCYYKANGTTRYMTPTELHSALYKMGDNIGRLKSLLMHSTVAGDLGIQALSDKVDSIYGALVGEGNFPLTYGRRPLITDSSNMLTASVGSSLEGYGGYHSFALVEDAVVVTESEEPRVYAQPQLGGASVYLIYQGEFAYNVTVKGHAYGTGGVNPTDATLAASANWTTVANNAKGGPGVHIYSRARS